MKVGAIILDDATSPYSSVRKAFTLTISVADHGEIYSDLAGRFRVACREVGRSGTFADITTGKDYGVVEVPSWAWHRNLAEVRRLKCLSTYELINTFLTRSGKRPKAAESRYAQLSLRVDRIPAHRLDCARA